MLVLSWVSYKRFSPWYILVLYLSLKYYYAINNLLLEVIELYTFLFKDNY